MLKKGFRQLLAEADAAVVTVSVDDAMALHGQDEVAFIDVRESNERAAGFVAGSFHAPRAFLEFMVDPESPMYQEVFGSGRRLVLYCGSGGRSALAAKTLEEMGVAKVSHMAGGIAAWSQAGGPLERA